MKINNNAMAVGLEFINLIVQIKRIEEVYPGFENFKNWWRIKSGLGEVFWHDDYLFRDGAMNPMDMRITVEFWEGLGLTGLVEENGEKHWKDFCVVGFIEGSVQHCDWLEIMENGCVKHIDDSSDICIFRGNYFEHYN